MRLYYIVSEILLILSIIDSSVAAPVPSPAQEKPQARIDDSEVHTPEDKIIMLEKRGDQWYEEMFRLFGPPTGKSYFLPNQELPAAHPLSSPLQLVPADGWTDVSKPLSPIPKEPPQMSSPYRPPLSSQLLGPAGRKTNFEQPRPSIDEVPLLSSLDHLPRGLGEEWNKMWGDLIETHFPKKPEMPSAALPSSSSQRLGPAGGRTNIEQPRPSIDEESLLSSMEHLPPSLGGEWNKMWRNLRVIETNFPGMSSAAHWRNLIETYFPEKPEMSSAALPLSSSQPLGPAGRKTNIEQPRPSIDEEPLLSSMEHLPPSLGGEWNKIWRNPIETNFPEKPEMSSAALPSSSSHWQPLGLAGGKANIEQPRPSIGEQPSPLSSLDHLPPIPGEEWNEMSQMWRNLLETHSPAKPEESPAARPPLSSQPSGLTDVSTNVEQPLPTIFKELSPESSPVRLPPSDELNNVWFTLFDHHFPANSKESSAARPLSGSPPSRPAYEWTDIEHSQPFIYEEQSLSNSYHFPPKPDESSAARPLSSSPSGSASFTTSSVDYKLMGTHALPNQGPWTESGHEMVGVPRPPSSASPVEFDHEISSWILESPTNSDSQWMGAGSSSLKRKRP